MMKQTYFQILKSLIQIPSPSGHEKELADFIIENYLVEGWVVERDEVHNILFCPVGDDKTEKLPLLYAHLDTHPNGESYKELLQREDIIYINDAGNIEKTEKIQMGFDDKAGVSAILYLMKHTELKFRALFVVQEETSTLPTKYERSGGGGIEYVIQNEEFGWVFEKSAYVLSLDRQRGNEIITAYGGNGHRVRIELCTAEFEEWVIKCSELAIYPMAEAHSDNVADVYNIRRSFESLNCVNLSIGYYCEHNKCEYLNINETLGVIRVVKECLLSRANFS
jgi:di/tripeptidase